MRALPSLLACLCWQFVGFAFAGDLLAQTPSAAPGVPVSSQAWVFGANDMTREGVEHLRQLLLDVGVEVSSEVELREQFEREVSSPPASLSEAELDAWAEHSSTAIRSIARTDYESALAALSAAQELSERAAEELNRREERARDVLDTCLYLVRAYQEQSQLEEALRQARECRRLVPFVEPSEYRHTPEVVDILARVDAAQRRGELHVTSEPEGCEVRMNGVSQGGVTPMTLRSIPHGEYRLQVECDPRLRGRTYRVRVGEEPLSVHVDKEYEGAFVSEPYVAGNSVRSRRFLSRLSSETGRTIYWLQHHEGMYAVVRVTPSGDLHEVYLDDRGPDAASMRALSRGESWDFRTTPPERLDAEEVPDLSSGSSAVGRLSKVRLGVGLATLALGLGGAGMTLYFHAHRLQLAELYGVSEGGDPDFLTRQRRWLRSVNPFVTMGLVSSAVLSAAGFLLVRPRGAWPWWGYVSVGAGAVLGGLAIGLASTRSACGNVATERESCFSAARRGAVSALLGFVAIPLVVSPFGGLLSPGSEVQVSAYPLMGGGGIQLGGVF